MAAKRTERQPPTRLALKDDNTFVRYRNIVKTIKERISLEKNLAEARSLHAARTIRSLKGSTPSPASLYEASVREAATRARLTELKVTLYVEKELLKEAIDSTVSHIRSAYDMTYVGSTQEERKLALRSMLRSGYRLLDELNAALDVLDFVIKDIDQCGYSLRNMIDIVKIQIERPGQHV